jgi:hypothetical protein
MVPQIAEGLSANIQKVRGHTDGVHSTEPSQDRMP